MGPGPRTVVAIALALAGAPGGISNRARAADTVPTGTAAVFACDSAPYHQFDFWLGSWTVDQEILQGDGTYAHYPAVDRVERAADGCAVVEHWRGIVQFFWENMAAPDSLYGYSIRSFDPLHGTWSILWISSRHAGLTEPFTGTFEGKRGTFIKRIPQADGTTNISRIVFEHPGTDTVEWSIATSSDGGTTWRTVWRMHFRKTTPSEGRPTDRAALRGAPAPAPQ